MVFFLLAMGMLPAPEDWRLIVLLAAALPGPLLHAWQPRHRMMIEEKVKDAKLSPDAAQGRIRGYRLLATALTVLGGVVVAMVLIDTSK